MPVNRRHSPSVSSRAAALHEALLRSTDPERRLLIKISYQNPKARFFAAVEQYTHGTDRSIDRGSIILAVAVDEPNLAWPSSMLLWTQLLCYFAHI
jgi:hypothetical protein